MSIITDIEKRLKYFTGQFLQAKDFEDEQNYHIDRQRRHNRLFHTPGIAEGLDVSVTDDRKKVNVTSGTAVDIDGCQIFLMENQIVPLTATDGSAGFVPGQLLLLVISFAEHPSDMATVGVEKKTRWHEDPVIKFVATEVDPREAENIELEDKYVPLAMVVLDAEGSIDTDEFDVSGGCVRVWAGTSAENISAESIGALIKIDGMENPGGNIDLKKANAITITHDEANKRITIGEGHSTDPGNPHGVTAAQTGAIVRIAGVGSNLDGDIQLVSSGQVDIQPNLAKNAITFEVNAVPNNDSTVMLDATHWTFTHNDSIGTVDILNTYKNAGYALFVSAAQAKMGALMVDGDIYLNGTLNAQGEKKNYVVDGHVNGSRQPLRTGDVVKLKGTPVSRFHGINNRIPAVEVLLADEANDTKVIGIVAGEAKPEPDAPDNRIEPDDPTCIKDGGEVLVVTLGAFSHCKVDASGAPIEVGDLLTTSSNPGHAKKATEPKIGSIIGKALEPLESGTGYIAVFVNIQ